MGCFGWFGWYVTHHFYMYIEKRGKSLLIRFAHDGKPYSFSLPKHNNPVGEAAAKLKIAQIGNDITYGNFDTTLLRYKPRKLGKNPTDITAVQLIKKYAAERQSELSRSSIDRLKAIASKLSQFLGDKPAAKVTESVAKDTIARWSKTAQNGSIKTYLSILKNCWDWAEGKYHLADSNPWSESHTRLKQRGVCNQPKRQKPFTIAELQAIFSAFVNHRHYRYYADFVLFLSKTACRFGEGAGLRWTNIGTDFSTAWIGESISRGVRNKKGTKTGKARTIQLPPSIRSMLADRFTRLKPQPNDLVFPAPKGGALDDHNFNNRAWKTILKLCQIEYRSPYNLRHSAISHALANGANPIALAEQTGHDVRVMLKTYAHVIDRKCLFLDWGDDVENPS